MGISPYWVSATLALAALICGAFALLAVRLPIFPGRTHFVITQVALFWWTACDTVEHLQSRPESALFWAEMANLGIVLGPTCWGLFIWNYVHGRQRPSPRLLDWAAGIFAVGIWLIALTNDRHHLIYRGVIAVQPPLFGYSHGPVYIAYHAALFAIGLLAYGTLLYAIVQADRIYRLHYIGLALATTFPWLTNAAYFTGALPIPFDITPFTFFLTNGLFYWMIRRRQMFDLLPLAHGLLLDVMPDPVLVVDQRDRVAECNAATRQLASGGPLVGQKLADLPALRDLLTGPETDGREVVIGEPPRTFDVGGVPLSYGGQPIGRLVILRDVTWRKQAELKLQDAMTELERQLQANIDLQRQLKEETIHDPLTGLHNRRFFDELAPVLVAETDRSGQPLAVVIIDIDHFKRLNDGHGHQAGDAMLRAVGAFLRQNSRQSDMVVRFGGEEFLVLMPHTRTDQALARLDEWRRDFAGQTIDYEGRTLAATFSAGIALYPEHAPTLDEALRRADLALYKAKAEGRNRCAPWDETITA